MVVGERDRRELQEALVSALGPDPADTLLGYLPPVGWADVATKRDLDGKLDAVENRLGGRIDRLEGRVDILASRFEGRLHHEMHKQDLWLLGMTLTIVLALFAQMLALFALR